MDEHPASALRRRADTSIGIATSLVKHGEADAVVSAGNTGATMAAALLLLGRIRGIDRPALCGMLPTTKGKPACLLDAGATMDADEHNILQFARMAARFMEQVHGVAGVSVVTHGRARANMMRRAIEVAERAVDTRLVDVIAEIPTRNAA